MKRPSSVALSASCCERRARPSHVLARDAALFGDALGRRELIERRVPGPVGGLEEARAVDHVGAEADVAHHLDAARDADVDAAGPDQRVHEVVGLLARAALRVDGRAGDAVLLAAGEPGVARDVVRLLARLGDAAADDLLDLGGVDAGAFDDGLLDLRQQMSGVERAERALRAELAFADRRSERFDDDGFSHGGYSFPRIMALVGMPTPAVTSTWSFFLRLIDRGAADQPHAFVHAVHAVDVGLAELPAVGVARQAAADFEVAVLDEVLGLAAACRSRRTRAATARSARRRRR